MMIRSYTRSISFRIEMLYFSLSASRLSMTKNQPVQTLGVLDVVPYTKKIAVACQENNNYNKSYE